MFSFHIQREGEEEFYFYTPRSYEATRTPLSCDMDARVETVGTLARGDADMRTPEG